MRGSWRRRTAGSSQGKAVTSSSALVSSSAVVLESMAFALIFLRSRSYTLQDNLPFYPSSDLGGESSMSET